MVLNHSDEVAKPSSQVQKPLAADDDDMDPTQYFENKLKALAAQKEAGKNPYPHKIHVSISVLEYVEKYGGLSSGEHLEDVEVSLAGRITNKRSSSSKLFFYDLHGGGAKVQDMADARRSDLDEAEFAKFHSGVKHGDIVGIKGFLGMIKELTCSYKVKYHANGLGNEPIEINFTPPFRRIDMIEDLEKMANLSIPKDLASEEDRKYLADACTKFDIK
ncbi:hypothetical protein LguiB_005636 [Lonicera macranthoides]